MDVKKFEITPPSLEDIAEKLKEPLARNFKHATASVVQCPDLRQPPFSLAAEGLNGQERIGDIGGQPNLFPKPLLDKIFPLSGIADAMEMTSQRGSLLGASAGLFNSVGQNSELCPNFSWEAGLKDVQNKSRFVHISPSGDSVCIKNSPTLNCAIMANLFGSLGEPGPVLKITARGRKGSEHSFTEFLQKALQAAYGDNRTVSLGGTFLIKAGKANFHVMPDFPQEDMKFKDTKDFLEFLTYHDCDGPIVCLTVVNSADPGKKMGLKLDHAHGFSATGNGGGHYHYDVDGEEIEYVGYFNTAKTIYRIEPPSTSLEKDLLE